MNKTQMLLFFVLSGCFAIPGYSHTEVECDSYDKLVEILQQDPSAHIVLTNDITVKPSDKRLNIFGQLDFKGHRIHLTTGTLDCSSLNPEKQKWVKENMLTVCAMRLFNMNPGVKLRNCSFVLDGSDYTYITKLELNGNDAYAEFLSRKDITKNIVSSLVG